MRVGRLELAASGALALALALPAPAGATLFLGADVSKEPGQIALVYVADTSYTRVDVSERVGEAAVPVTTIEQLNELRDDKGNVRSFGIAYRAATWRCDRVNRRFEAMGHREDGGTEASSFSVRTPSCRNRLRLTAARRARVGARVVVGVRDSFELGGVKARLCVRAPGAPRACRGLRIAAGRTQAKQSFRARRGGRWKVTLESDHQRLRRVVAVGVPAPPATTLPLVLTTGDSLMQSVDAILGDRLTNRARVRTDVHLGSGISTSFVLDWSKLPARHVRRMRPAATVLFLGTNDGWPMKLRDGTEVACCDEPWVAEYARRARRAIRTYLRNGQGAVVWLNIPIARDPKRTPRIVAVNAALSRAVAGIDRAAVVDLATLLTPDGVYRDHMTIGGRRARVRQGDGIHLSSAGAALAVREVMRRLERFGVI